MSASPDTIKIDFSNFDESFKASKNSEKWVKTKENPKKVPP